MNLVVAAGRGALRRGPLSFPARAFSSLQEMNLIKTDDDRILVRSVEKSFFNISGEVVQGGVFLLPTSYVQWNCSKVSDITADSLALLEVRKPNIDLIILGVGASLDYRPNEELREYLDSMGVSWEMMGSFQAAATYNFLQDEGRRVACAMLPVDPVPVEPVVKPRSVLTN